jgi:hypothetical protein
LKKRIPKKMNILIRKGCYEAILSLKSSKNFKG